MRARLRAPGGVSTITLADDATIQHLIAEIKEKTSISNFDVKYGYPPRPLRLEQYEKSQLLSTLDVKLDGEQLTISPRDDPSTTPSAPAVSQGGANKVTAHFSFTNAPGSQPSGEKKHKPIALKTKVMDEDVPEIPLPGHGATLVLRVMPDDNSCLFRAFGTAVLPGDDQSMPELRSLVASAIQAEPDVYSTVVLEREPDDYCRWIQTQDAWGGAIEMGILANHFDIEICSIDVKSLRVDKFNEGKPTRCILVYSGIHYDTIVQSPSDPPHTKADAPPDFDKRVFDSDDDALLVAALELCKKLQSKNYYTDTGGMKIKCQICGSILIGQGQANAHAQQTGHYDMAEIPV
ncbi:hypothetical protein HYALB_00009957 [Hymenoscyphus albidus]|uniref:Ubiquitin thioesterase OTU n=1 Tax=Hymenoscyphus albidus TaxID=595503 RepID=A0A9N9LWZ6_9HELO|nr:hypothetical protein HYALB_00009957 [Hymenoscyphus albidus]